MADVKHFLLPTVLLSWSEIRWYLQTVLGRVNRIQSLGWQKLLIIEVSLRWSSPVPISSISAGFQCLWICRGTVCLSVLLQDAFFVVEERSTNIFNWGSLDDHRDFLFEGIPGNGASFLFKPSTNRSTFCPCSPKK